MKYLKFFIILPLIGWGGIVQAQDQMPAQQMQMPEQWQLTLDVIKSRAQTLLMQNNGLEMEYRQLIAQVQKLRQSIVDQQYKNDQMNQFLKMRHGQTDQFLRIQELKRSIATKKQQAKDYIGQLDNLSRKNADLAQIIQGLRQTVSAAEMRQEQARQAAQQPAPVPTTPQVDDQLIQLRKQLEEQSRQEVLLENQLATLKAGGKAQHLNLADIQAQNQQLEIHLDDLRLQKLHHEKMSSDERLSQATTRMYDQLKMRKEQLEAKIYAYEMHMDELRQSSLTELSWPLKKKRLVHEMVQIDNRNNQMRDKIKELKEDIDVLKGQVRTLEHRLNGHQSKENFVTLQTGN